MTKGKKWSDLGRILGYRGIPGLSTQIKNSYTRVILPYEHFSERNRSSPAMSPVTARDAQLKTHTNIQKPSRLSNAVTSTEDNSPPASPLTNTSSPLSEPPDESESKDGMGKASSSKLRRSTRMGSQEQCQYEHIFVERNLTPSLQRRKSSLPVRSCHRQSPLRFSMIRKNLI